MACSKAEVEAAVCSRAGNEVATCSGAGIKDGRVQHRRDGF
jgi:hypothetical protein